MNEQKQRAIKYYVVFALFICLILLWIFRDKVVPDKEQEWNDDLSQDIADTITYQGQEYYYNTDIKNVLFLGIDKNDVIRDDNLPGDAGQTDCIMLVSFNQGTKQAQIIQIPRDTMTEIDMYDTAGRCYNTITQQIATQYAYARGGKDSCWATKKTVSELLYDLPIDAYLAMDMSSIPSVHDAIGGVTLTFPEDYTEINPLFQKDTTLKLTGEQAYSYVRYRDTTKAFSNNDRMKRQAHYIPALIDAVQLNAQESDDYYSTLYGIIEEYMMTDFDESDVETFSEYQLATSEIRYLPGEGKKGEIYEEFHINEEALQKMLIETFYILKK